ncbi:hypothetical protein VPH35_003452 [Triticum aestivum]|uniref:HMA domain-containing protein n=1 Tax=Triticum aestivum TaxID=4565 RepID=A0A3B5Y2V9_WHEAT|nr:protein SODIUM POTASSIUM ROOT DEFECTIVE 2-like [Triticum aestivum]
MRTGGMLCRSQAATAVCVPGDARSMVVGRRADRTIAQDARTLHDVRYVRLGADGAGAARVSSRRVAPPQPPPMSRRRGATVAVTLPMVTKSPVETPARDTAAAKRTPATPTAAVAPGDQVLQVVVMKVAIHCQGCAGKVRKHISKMEGVTSFSIDLESKKVTVMGHVSPAGVLESISKVKKAELLM